MLVLRAMATRGIPPLSRADSRFAPSTPRGGMEREDAGGEEPREHTHSAVPQDTSRGHLRRYVGLTSWGKHHGGKGETRPVDRLLVRLNAVHLMQFSGYFSTADPDIIQRQERQIVQSCMNLDDSLPGFTPSGRHLISVRRRSARSKRWASSVSSCHRASTGNSRHHRPYFPLKLPVALDSGSAVFVYADPGHRPHDGAPLMDQRA